MPDQEANPAREKVLAEVLLEIRFTGAPDVSLLVGKMHDALHQNYSIFENLNIPDFPEGIPNVDNIVRYRIFSEDKSKLYNLGKGVLSINTVNYSHFADFMQDARTVLEKYKEISSVNSISRIGLRYINKIVTNQRPFDQLFRISFDLPESLRSIEAGFSFQTIGKVGNDILITKFITAEPLSKNAVILDFDYYTEQGMAYDLDAINRWATNAQTAIVTNFRNILTGTYYQTLTQ